MVKVTVIHPDYRIDGVRVEVGSVIEVSEECAEKLIDRRIASEAPQLEVATPKPTKRKPKQKPE